MNATAIFAFLGGYFNGSADRKEFLIMAIVTIVGAGMMGSALAFPARENGNEVRLVGTPLDREIIDACRETNRHPKFKKDFPEGLTYYQIEELHTAINGADFIICGHSLDLHTRVF